MTGGAYPARAIDPARLAAELMEAALEWHDADLAVQAVTGHRGFYGEVRRDARLRLARAETRLRRAAAAEAAKRRAR